MANIVRFDPFSTVTPIERTFDDLFNSLLRPLQSLAPIDQELRSFKMDVHETDKDYIVHADLPGVQKEDIHVSIEGNQVTIDAEARELPWQTAGASQEGEPAQQADSAKNLRRERHVGRIYRSFTLPVEIDDSKARAKYDNGVLTLTLPKKQQLGKQLAIE